METKSTSIKRELLTQLVTAYGNKPKKIVIQKAKEKGIYKFEEDDNEIYLLIHAFAKFHNLPFGYFEEKIVKENNFDFNLDPEKEVETPFEVKIDGFYESLLKERNSLSKKLLSLNKLIDTYEKEREVNFG